MASVYQINKGINKPVEFKGLKSQYIWYLGAGILALIILFAAMYITGVSTVICMVVILAAGTGLVMKVYQLSNKYGEHGLMKAIARRSTPKAVRSFSRKIFFKESLTKNNYGKKAS